MIRDHKNRQYWLISANDKYTHLECLSTGALIIITSDKFTEMGFR